MNSTSGYELVSGKVAVDGTSSLAIFGVIKDQASPSAVASSIEKNGVGTLVLSGANTYTDGAFLNTDTISAANNAELGAGSLVMANGTTVSVGILAGSTASFQGNIVSNAVVNFNQTANGTYAGVMSGLVLWLRIVLV